MGVKASGKVNTKNVNLDFVDGLNGAASDVPFTNVFDLYIFELLRSFSFIESDDPSALATKLLWKM